MDASLVSEDFFSKSKIPTFNLTFKPLFIVVFFWMIHNKKIFRRSNVKWSIYLMSLKKWRANVNCPKIVAYTVKIVKFLVRVISEHP